MTGKSRDRHHGGQEPPDSAQNRPEQNAGYDAAVRGESTATPLEPSGDLGLDDLSERNDDGALQLVADPSDGAELSPDDRAERDVIAEVRRREKRR